MMNLVQGFSEPEFEPVAQAFAKQAQRGEPGGSSVSIFKDGIEVVNLWQGQARADAPWQSNTVSDIFSCTKGVATIVCAMLADQGVLDFEAPVANYWPEFAQNGKAEIKVKTALQHRAGLSAVRNSLTHAQIVDGHSIADELAAQAPLWQPGTTWAYHALTFGTLASKIIDGATGQTVGQYVASKISPLLNLDLWIGLPSEKLPQVAPLISDGNFTSNNAAEFSDGWWLERAMTMGGGLPVDPTHANGFNSPATLAAELPGANGVANAHSLAKLYSAAVTETEGVRLVSDEVLRLMCEPASSGANAFNEPLPTPVWGTGFMVDVPGKVETPAQSGFGHNGLGGQSAWGNIEHKIGFGYTTNYLKNTAETTRNQDELIAALNAVLAG